MRQWRNRQSPARGARTPRVALEPLESRRLLDGVPVAQGPEFRINTFTAGQQGLPAVAADADGDFVVVWQSYAQEGSSWNVYGQRYAADGTPRGGEFRVNQTVGEDGGYRDQPAVAMDADGEFMVVWEQFDPDGTAADIFARRYDASGAGLGDEFRVNSTILGFQRSPSIGMNGAGDAVVTWTGWQGEGEGAEIYAQQYRPGGEPFGGEFRVNSDLQGAAGDPDVAVGDDGSFVVAWDRSGPFRTGHVACRVFHSDGEALGDEFFVTPETLVNSDDPAVAMDADGDFVIAWPSQGGGVFARRYNASGEPFGPAFLALTQQSTALGGDVAMDEGGEFLVLGDCATDGADNSVAGHFYDASGEPRTGEFHVNNSRAGAQSAPAVAMTDRGQIVAAWQSGGQDGSGGGVYARRYQLGTAPPPATVVGRQAFYNGSSFDGRDLGAGAADDGAIASDKQALLPRAAATFVNVTSYDKGLNGVIIDVAGLAQGLDLLPEDFTFRRGLDPDRNFWLPGPAPESLTVRRGAGVNGSDRVTLTWRPYNPASEGFGNLAVGNAWLEVTVKANEDTGLARPDVFAFGNLVGETGDRTGGVAGFRVNALDVSAVKRFLNAAATVTSPTDFNRDGRTNALDLAIIKRNLNRTLLSPAPSAAPAQDRQEPAAVAARATDLLRG